MQEQLMRPPVVLRVLDADECGAAAAAVAAAAGARR